MNCISLLEGIKKMKKKLIVLLSIMIVIILSSILIINMADRGVEEDDKFTIVTSFYPMYILTKNLVKDQPNIEVVNLTDYQSGCLHDYQLTTSDMMKLEDADIFVMNGGGMESFMDDVLSAYPNLPVINASEGIDFLISEGHDHEEEEITPQADIVTNDGLDNVNTTDVLGDTLDDKETTNINKEESTDIDIKAEQELNQNSEEETDEEEEYNAHVWLNMNYYITQIQNVQSGLKEFDPDNGSIYDVNGNSYIDEVKILKEEVESSLNEIANKEIVIFHDSFAYLAEELGLEVVHIVNMDTDSSLSAGEIAEVIDEVNLHDIKVLFTEEQYSTSIADNIASETGAVVYVIDSIVDGDMTVDGYLTAMRKNLEVLKTAFE
jgi:zinc transport system substrate-binding protein